MRDEDMRLRWRHPVDDCTLMCAPHPYQIKPCQVCGVAVHLYRVRNGIRPGDGIVCSTICRSKRHHARKRKAAKGAKADAA